MAVLELRYEGDPILKQRARPVEKITKRIVKLLKDMEDTMYAAEGVGLAGPQIGVGERLVVLDVGEGPMHLINPVLVKGEGSDVDREGCLSIPGVYGYVDRYAKVLVEALDPKGKPVRLEAEGLLARVLQHEIDHLDGILFIEKATGITKIDEQDSEAGDDGSKPGEGEGNEKT